VADEALRLSALGLLGAQGHREECRSLCVLLEEVDPLGDLGLVSAPHEELVVLIVDLKVERVFSVLGPARSERG